ncbi:MAG: adenine deaminase C-terminal domain-containing protein [Candidatus Dormibacteraceae bacterium]
MSLRLWPGPAQRRALAEVAGGRRAADLVLRGGALVDVFTDEILEGWGVAALGDRVATVGPDAGLPVGPGTEVVELAGRLVAPGLVESHTHLVRASLQEQIAGQVRAGVTTTFVETLEPAFVGGIAAVQALLAEAATVTGRAFLTLGGLPVPDRALEARLPEAGRWAPLLDELLVAGVGEMYWAEVLRGHQRTEGLVEEALRRGLTAEGHGAGARHASLAGLAALGAAADHEGIDAADLRTRLRLGLWAEARQGATRQDLDAIAPLWQEGGLDLRRLTFVCDGVEPADLLAGRSLNGVVERARDLGLPLPTAIRMASQGPAERFGVGRWLGGLTPGAFADLVVLPRGGPVRPELVLVGGRRPAEPAPLERPRIASGVGVARLDDAVLRALEPGRLRAMRLEQPTVTREAEVSGEDPLWVIALDREDSRRAFRGLLLGFGMARGAVAWSSGWEAAGPVLAGNSVPDLRAALERLCQLDGGAVVAGGGRVLAEWAAPITGLLSPAPLTAVAAQARQVGDALHGLGARTPNPLLTLETLTTTAIPFLRITPEGYYRARDGSRPGLLWEGPAATG